MKTTITSSKRLFGKTKSKTGMRGIKSRRVLAGSARISIKADQNQSSVSKPDWLKCAGNLSIDELQALDELDQLLNVEFSNIDDKDWA